MIYRQGDILLKPINSIPEEARKKNLVLAEGEVTGHYHQFVDPTIVSVYEVNEQQYVNVREKAELTHDEHHNLFIEKGVYEVVRQREVDLLNEVRQVMD
ncbi:MAG: hypothetical protein OEL89_01305 [Candidatus Peregrinibacteria bacterium]|nr:hypothetical protein [Candidatus Peregrinibacteria bacterium]